MAHATASHPMPKARLCWGGGGGRKGCMASRNGNSTMQFTSCGSVAAGIRHRNSDIPTVVHDRLLLTSVQMAVNGGPTVANGAVLGLISIVVPTWHRGTCRMALLCT